MICRVCGNDGIFVELNTCHYYYCRTCKNEIELEVVNRPSTTEKTFEDSFMDLLNCSIEDSVSDEIMGNPFDEPI